MNEPDAKSTEHSSAIPADAAHVAESSEQEIRERLAEELRQMRVEDMVIGMCASLTNLGIQRLGLSDETRKTRDLDQARVAIDSVRAVLPVVEELRPEDVRAVRDGLSRVQMAYAQVASGTEPAAGSSDEPKSRTVPEDASQGASPKTPETPRKSGIWVPPGTAT